MTALDRDREIVAVYRELGVLSRVAQQYGLTRERVRQIVAKYERATGELLSRPGIAIMNAERSRAAEVVWRCPGCGEERRYLRSQVRHERCIRCKGGAKPKYVADEALQSVIRRREAGESWTALARQFGYRGGNSVSRGLIQRIYNHLRRTRDRETINRLWPHGVPPYLQKQIVTPPQHCRGAS